jgi:hypothetical protein
VLKIQKIPLKRKVTIDTEKIFAAEAKQTAHNVVALKPSRASCRCVESLLDPYMPPKRNTRCQAKTIRKNITKFESLIRTEKKCARNPRCA